MFTAKYLQEFIDNQDFRFLSDDSVYEFLKPICLKFDIEMPICVLSKAGLEATQEYVYAFLPDSTPLKRIISVSGTRELYDLETSELHNTNYTKKEL